MFHGDLHCLVELVCVSECGNIMEVCVWFLIECVRIQGERRSRMRIKGKGNAGTNAQIRLSPSDKNQTCFSGSC